jgi:hypothetical protein
MRAVLIFHAITDGGYIDHHFWFDKSYLSLTYCLAKRIELAAAWANSNIIHLECLIQ